jgi:GTP cyclohydrolase I
MKLKIIILNLEESNLDNIKVQGLIKDLLSQLGENPEREGLLNTPKRVAKAYEFLTSGYSKNIDEVLNNAIFHEKYDEMVLVKNIDFYSLCEHHMLPFYGKVHVAYIPDGKIVGLSKIPRIVEVFARRLQVQERMTQEIADTIEKYLQPKGVAVVSEAYHMCMMMRGVEKQNSSATASAVHGLFQKDARTRAEFLNLISNKSL